MKIALACQSVLLEKSLEIFLKKYISSYKQCDFVISDRKIEIEKPLFYIAPNDADLNLPFASSNLLLALEKFYHSLHVKENSELKMVSKEINLQELEEKITRLTNEFRNNLITVIKEYYE